VPIGLIGRRTPAELSGAVVGFVSPIQFAAAAQNISSFEVYIYGLTRGSE
jgi:hypothetical protein